MTNGTTNQEATMTKANGRDLNVYQDPQSGGWVREVRGIGSEWYVVGVYGTREAALAG